MQLSVPLRTTVLAVMREAIGGVRTDLIVRVQVNELIAVQARWCV